MKKTTAIFAAGAIVGIVLAFAPKAAAAELSDIVPANSERVLEKMSAGVFTAADGFALPYRIYRSPACGEKGGTGGAVLFLYLHGSGGRGGDNEMQIKDQPTLVNYLVSDDADEALKGLPYLVVAPQCPQDMKWVDTPYAGGSYDLEKGFETQSLKAVCELLQSLLESGDADGGNVVLYGISMGGYGVWDFALRHPRLVRSAVPICGAGDPSLADRLAGVRVWAFHCEGDGAVPVSGSREMAAALKAAGIDAKYTEFPLKAHNAWTPAMEVKDPSLLSWILDGVGYEVKTEAEGGGTVSAGKRVKRGGSLEVDIMPDEGYELSELYVDGARQDMTPVGSYVFSDVNAPHSLRAVFAEKSAAPASEAVGEASGESASEAVLSEAPSGEASGEAVLSEVPSGEASGETSRGGSDHKGGRQNAAIAAAIVAAAAAAVVAVVAAARKHRAR